MESKFAAMRRGMLEPVVLALLDGESHYAGEIATMLREAEFPIQDGTLHPLLNRMRRDGLLQHEWQESPAGPPRKYLSLTTEGRDQLIQFRDYFRRLAQLIEQ